jgi:hypothetical protein
LVFEAEIHRIDHARIRVSRGPSPGVRAWRMAEEALRNREKINCSY